MKKIYYLLAISILFILPVNLIKSQTTGNVNKHSASADTKKTLLGKIKEIEETNSYKGKITKNFFKFNEQGKITNMDLNSCNGNVNIKIDLEYDNDGNLIKRTFSKKIKDQNLLGPYSEINAVSFDEEPFRSNIDISSSSGWDNEVITIDYSNGKRTKEISMANENNNQKMTERYYNANEKMIRYIEKNGDQIQEFNYNNEGKIVSQKLNGEIIPPYDDDFDEGWGEPEYKYDVKGRVISFEGDGSSIKYKYNINNFLTSIMKSDHWWGDTSTTFTNYAYDTKKNWIKRTKTIKGDYYGKTPFIVTTSRKIIYY